MTDLEKYYEAKEAYYNGESIMTDLEFDELERSLGLENKSMVGTRHNPSYTIKHPFIMGSLSKVQIKENEDGTVNWEDYYNDICSYIKRNHKDPDVIISPKYDGCSFEVVVGKKGKIESISSRGDGEYGKNLYDHLINHVKSSIDQLYNDFGTAFTCRGEVLIKKSIFESKYSEFVNPRSFVSGVLNRDYTNEPEFQEMLNDLSIVIYDIRWPRNDGTFAETDFSSFKYDTKPEFYKEQVVLNTESFKKYYELFAEYREKCEFALDGFVIKPTVEFRVENITDPRPKDCVAVKFIPMLEETVVEEIIWSTRKTNELIPVIKVRPVIMDGKEVTRASAHNYGYLLDNKISVGTKVILSLAGDIIPFIYKVTDTSTFDINKLCLPNNIETIIDGCHLNKVLSEQEVKKKRFMNSVSALNIPNMGPSIAERLFDYLNEDNFDKEYEDFFEFEQKEVVDNILLVHPCNIEMSIGGKIGTSVKKAFDKIIKSLTLKDIILSLSIEDCGPKIAEQIEKQLLYGNGDFTHLSEKAYKWVFDENSEERKRILNILIGLNMKYDDFKKKLDKEIEKS